MATRTRTSARAYPASVEAGSSQDAQKPQRRSFIQGLREDMHFARSMANGRRLRGENVTNLSDDEFLAKVYAAAAPR